VAECLKEKGWLIASHSYGHPSYGKIEADRVALDSDKWEDTVQYIVGETDIILFPHGSDIHTWRPYTTENEKFNSLYEDGYRYFFNVDSKVAWVQIGDTYFRASRRNIDGYRMYHYPERLEDLFDVKEVFDPARPTPVPDSGPGM
jgi:peptidoglycan/xylan/chitin deacetylase (PgdA/CDA1 family)